jgi:hypothetical protein
VQPPAVRREALHTAGSTWLRLRIDSRVGLHAFSLLLPSHFLCKPCFDGSYNHSGLRTASVLALNGSV